MNKVFIYTLADPITNEIKYVGQTKNITNRLYRHIHDAKPSDRKNKRCAWIKSLLNKNLKPNIDILDIVNYSDWVFWEQYWIAQFKAWGFELTNMTEGGEGSYNRNVSEETKTKMSIAKKGKTPQNYDVFRKSTIKNPIVQYNLKGEFVKKWPYLQTAIDATKISNIKQVINKERCSSGGFIWRNENDFLSQNELDFLVVKHKKLTPKPVGQYSIDDELIKTWPSYQSVKKIYGHIGSVLSGKRKTAGGYVWKYIIK